MASHSQVKELHGGGESGLSVARAFVCVANPSSLLLAGRTASESGEYARSFGRDILDRYEERKPDLSVPEMSQILKYLRDLDKLPDQLVVVVTDQPNDSETYQNDTVSIGEVAGRLMREQFDLQKKSSVPRLRSNPFSLDGLMNEISKLFHTWDKQYTDIYLISTGGTSALAIAMFLNALDVCPDKVKPIDVQKGGLVRPMNVVQRIRASQRRRDIALAVEHGRFAAAISLIPDDAEDLSIPNHIQQTLVAVLKSAEKRLRFDLLGARKCLASALEEPKLHDDLYEQIFKIQQYLPAVDNPMELLRELYHNAHYQLQHQEYADFVLRLFNFYQAALRQAAEGSGVSFERRGEYISSTWLKERPAFTEFVDNCPNPSGGIGLALDSGRATGPMLLCLIRYLVSERRLSANILKASLDIQNVVDLRNRCFAAHDFAQVGRGEIEAHFKGSEHDLLESMWILFAEATGRNFGPDPFSATRQLCSALLEV